MSDKKNPPSPYRSGWLALRPVMFSVLAVVAVQLWLFMSSLEDILGRRFDRAVPMAAGSGLCFLANLWLLRRVRAIDTRRDSSDGNP